MKATVETVVQHEDGSGTLCLSAGADPRRLEYATAPYEVTALNGLPIAIQSGGGWVWLGLHVIADRTGPASIVFVARRQFLEAVRNYHARTRHA